MQPSMAKFLTGGSATPAKRRASQGSTPASKKKKTAPEPHSPEEEEAGEGVVLVFLQAYVEKKAGGQLVLSTLRECMKKAFDIRLKAQSPMLSKMLIKEFGAIPAKTHQDVKAANMGKTRGLLTLYKVKEKVSNSSETVVYGLDLRAKPKKLPAGAALPELLVKDVTVQELYRRCCAALGAGKAAAPDRYPYPTTTPIQASEGWYRCVVEGVFHRVEFAICEEVVTLTCVRRVQPSAYPPSGIYTTRVVLPGRADPDNTTVTRGNAGVLSPWIVTVKLLPPKEEVRGVAEEMDEDEYAAVLGVGFAGSDAASDVVDGEEDEEDEENDDEKEKEKDKEVLVVTGSTALEY